MKPCRKCGESERYADGRCKGCTLARNEVYAKRSRAEHPERNRSQVITWQKANPEKAAAKSKRYRARNAETVRAKSRARYAEDPALHKFRNRFYKYGLTADAAKTMLAAQGDRCDICRKPLDLSGRGAVVDHDHAHPSSQKRGGCGRGAVRGILCGGCNIKLAALDNAAWYIAARAYLARFAIRTIIS